ncbi:MAG: pilus assembly protein TadG-related protein [Actinomycetia bacterium]|nr:pilus assembly protein TadG-related protein [Actinomycetes bacterium]
MRLPRFHRAEPTNRERGAVLILVAASMVAFIGMAGLTVDLGWLFLQSSNVKKATEAAALAAVTHMPLPVPQAAGSEVLPGLPASDAADAIAVEHGYSSTATITKRWAKSTQARVDITSSTNTFFMGFFGIDTVSLRRHSIAEQLPPLKLGSDGNRMGTEYDDDDNLISNEFYWLGINGEERRKEDGDPFSTRCDSNGCAGTQNPQHRDPAYYYAIDVAAVDVTGSTTISVLVFDGSNDNTSPDRPDDLSSGGTDTFSFTLIEPDATPGDPTDNRTNAGGATVCPSHTFANDDGSNVWQLVCSFDPEKQGIYVLEVSAAGDDTAINGFALQVSGGSGDTSVYGLGYMSLWMRDAGSSPTLQIVRLDEVYAGSQMIINAFDLGDISGSGASGHVIFGGALAGIDCRVRELNTDYQNPTAWRNDDGGGSSCRLVTKSGGGGSAGIYNNRWVEFLFDVPPNHTCSGAGCWATVTYNFTGGSPTDRTTWGARINGTPIHLLRDSTPAP